MKKETREKISYLATERIINKESDWGLKNFGNKKRKFRSMLEYSFSVYLDELNIKYEFEEHGEKIENYSGMIIHYIPDFFLPDYGVNIEIVNHMDKRLKNKMYYFQEQNKLQKLIVFDRKALRDMYDSRFNIYDIIGYPKEKIK